MDVIDASHFEQIKKFIIERPWWEFKLSRHEGIWYLTFIHTLNNGPFTMVPFIHVSLGEALKLASHWCGEQFAIQERETEAVSICETPGNSPQVVATLRNLGTGEEIAIERCHCGKPIHYYEEMNNFTRGLCLECSTVRCDLDPSACK